MVSLRSRARTAKTFKRVKGYFQPLKPPYRYLRNRMVQMQMMARWAVSAIRRRNGRACGMQLPPKGFYESTLNWFAKSSHLGDNPASEYRAIFPARKVPPSRVRTTGIAVNWDLEGVRYSSINQTFVAKICGGRTYGRFGDVIAPDGSILADLSFVYPSRLFAEKHEHSFFTRHSLPPATNVKGVACLLASHYGDTNYFHWMFNVLPRLELFRMAGTDLDSIDVFIVNQLRYAFHEETLTRLGIPLHKVMESSEDMHVHAECLMVAPSLRAGFHMEKWVCDFLREAFLGPHQKTSNKGRRFFVSREDARYRKLLNEGECIDFLGPLGFEKLTLDGLSVPDQVLLFSSAEAIIAPHGAGLANLVFCRPNTKVVELFSPVWLRPSYWELSNSIGLEYHYLLGGGADQPGKSDLKKDYTIDMKEFAEIIQIAGLDLRSHQRT